MAVRHEHAYDGFISYSHAVDRGLAKVLQRVLHRLGRPWYRRHALRLFRDDTTLAASPDLWFSIQRALLSARTFVLLASPASAASQWVRKEVALWRQERSRDNFLIVLTDGDLVWDRDAGDFDRARSSALPEEASGWFDAEPLWVDLRGHRDRVRKREFRDRAATVAAAIHGVPKDALLSEDARQQRRLVTLLSSLLVLAVVAGSVAVWQRNIAVAQRDRADTQARVALSRALAAEAEVQASADPRLAAQLAVAAHEAAATAEANGALLRELDRNRHVLAYIRRGTDQVSTQLFASAPTPTHVALSPDGSLLAFAHLGDSAVTLWDTHAQRAVGKLEPAPALRRGNFYSLSSGLSFNGDGTLLAADDGIRLQLWDVPDRRLIRAIDNAGGGVQVFLSPDGRWVSRAGDHRRDEAPVRVWRVDTGEELVVPAPASDVAAAAVPFDGSSKRMYAEFRDGIYVLDLDTRTWSKLVPFETDRPVGFAVASGAARLAVAAGNAIELWDLATRRKLSRHPLTGLHEPGFKDISADGGTLVLGDSVGRLLSMDITSGKITELARHRVGVADAAIDADGHLVASISADGDVILSTPAVDHRQLSVAKAPKYGTGRNGELLAAVTAAAIGPRGDLAVVGRWGGVEVWDLPDLRMRARISIPSESIVDGVAISPDQTTVAALADGVLTVADAQSGTVSARIPVETPRPPAVEGSEAVRFLPDGRRVLVDADHGPWVIDVHSQERTQQLPVGDSGGGIAANTDASLVALASQDLSPTAGGTWIEVWQWRGARYRQVARLHESAQVRDIAVSPDGTRLGLADIDGRVVVVDVADTSRRRVFKTPGVGAYSQLAFTRDGTTVVQADGHLGGVSLWDIAGERLLGVWQDNTVDGEGGGVLDVGADAQILSDRADGALVLWQGNIGTAIATLCRLAGELNPDDRARYMQDVTLPPMCSR